MLCQYTDLPIKMMTMMTTMIMIMKMLKWIIIWSQVCDSLHNHNLLLRENHGQTKVFASLSSSSSSSSWSDSGIRNIIIIITFYFCISIILYFCTFSTFVLLFFCTFVFLGFCIFISGSAQQEANREPGNLSIITFNVIVIHNPNYILTKSDRKNACEVSS